MRSLINILNPAAHLLEVVDDAVVLLRDVDEAATTLEPGPPRTPPTPGDITEEEGGNW